MAPSIDISDIKAVISSESKSVKSDPKPKKEKSSKKTKTKSLDEKSQTSVNVEEASSKPKKDKSSKKRKAELLDETPQTSVKLEKASTNPAPKAKSDALSPVPEDTSTQPPSKKRKSALAEEIEVDITAPEPPSKKALRLLKKGKPLPPSKSGADSPEPEAKKAKKTKVEKRSEHGVWIGNLPWHVSKDDLRKFLVEYSDITPEMITRVHMPGPNDGKPANKVEETKKYVKVVNNKGFAYVDFSSAEAVGYAVEVSEQLLSGRRVLIKDNKSYEGRPQKTKEESRNDGKPPSKRIFVGNLSFDTTEESLTEHFEKCGAIVNVKVATFEDSGKCKGYSWIVFEELEGAQNAVRGFLLVEEEEGDSLKSESEADSDSEGDKKSKPKKIKKRKVWVNRIKGRPLRMEFAEDSQVRYKKRYGKDGSKYKAAEGTVGTVENAGVADKVKEAPKKTEYMLPYGGAHMTGGIVESKGTKVTF